MTPTPDIQPLSQNHRRSLFVLAIIIFVLIVPALVFYAIGYRVDLSGETRNIRAVGGMYVSSDAEDIAIYIDDEPVEDMRFFQQAAYIQNLDAGLHQIHVQGEGIQTWVKDLPVYPHIVTEARSFNMPSTTQMRVITQYETEQGESVVGINATSSFAFASTTNVWYATSTKATTSFAINPEYTYVSTLFASSTANRKMMAEQLRVANERFRFGVDDDNTVLSTTTATTTKIFRDVELYEQGDEVMARWLGDRDHIPYYYCVTYRGEITTSLGYGSHVMEDLKAEYGTSTNFLDKSLFNTQMCRQDIRIDRKFQAVQYFDFIPDSEHHVLMQLQDGVYVVEIDDRSWQNVQLLYPGDYLEVVVDGGQIYIKDDENLLEVFTELI